MDVELELVAVPLTDVDRATACHGDQVSGSMRCVQLTPPGSACSVVLGDGVTDMPAGPQRGLRTVVEDAAAPARGSSAAG